ncbi:MAG: glycosyltransferase family protein [Chitinophagales bacterium]|nr:glycosyltransferase family protein [Chitinophagales bacterium]
MEILTVIQARTGSTRLPGKVMLPLVGKPLLVRMVERVKAAKLAGRVVVATTTMPQDDTVVELCGAEGWEVFRGHPENCLDRHYQAGVEYNADTVIKIPSDCPLIDPQVIDKVIAFYLDHTGEYDFVSNLHPATYPDGNDVEIMTMEALRIAWENASLEMEMQHTTPYIWERPQQFRLANVAWETGLDYSMSHRFTIDYQEDYDFIKAVYDELHPRNAMFGLQDILDLLEQRPDIYAINNHYAGVNWYRNHLDELKTVGKGQTRKI